MATNKMLIDASHPEETRVAVVRGNRVEEFDFESLEKQQLRGNIYLAKVTRVEPSLQAAFVDYGGNRHGFLAFAEIHPDYYQIPVADRQALLAEEAEDARASREADEADDDEASGAEAAASTEDSGKSNEEAEPPKKARRARRPRKRSQKAEQKPESDDSSAEEETSGSASEQADSDEKTASAETEGEPPAIDEETASTEAPVVETEADPAEVTEADPAEVTEADPAEVTDADPAEVTEDTSIEDPDAEPSVELKSSDEEDGDSSGPKSIAAINESDSISEQASEPEEEGAGDADDAKQSEKTDEEKPKRRRTSRRKVKQEAESDSSDAEPESATDDKKDDGPSEEGDAQVEVSGEDEGEKKTKPKRRRTSRRKTKKVPEAETDDIGAETGNGTEAETDPDLRENGDPDDDEDVESVGQEDALEEVPERRRSRRQYKIQEVIKRRQVMLVQVVKEERGNKGAALTTYLSLAGRYSVLMPNTARGGGISRKITNAADRKRLKQVAADLAVPEGMGVILRTAGATRTKAEINRDFDYLMRLWEKVRNLTLASSAPCLVYEEGSLIKRSIRDLYNKDIGEILVAGNTGYQEAKDFMGMLMPSHAKNVKEYTGGQAIFAKYGVESQLERMVTPQVTLKSGGYLVMNQTEALVAIDVNSGRSTREHSIEDTALQTNLEAAEEVARQLRLRDLAGLIVIDFIDMEEKRNNRAVEKKLKDCLKNDRARIQVGRISHFGLLEMSRQRIRASVLESTMDVCPHCQGMGYVRSESAIALHVFRAIEEHLGKHSRYDIIVKTNPSIALYILNHKRAALIELEQRYGLRILLQGDMNVVGQEFTIDRGDAAQGKPNSNNASYNGGSEPVEADQESSEDDPESGDRKRRRRRRKGKKRTDDNAESNVQESETGDEVSDAQSEDDAEPEASSEEEAKDKRSKTRRGKRGGRRKKSSESGEADLEATEAKTDDAVSEAEQSVEEAVIPEVDEESEESADQPRNKRPRRSTSRPGKVIPAEVAIDEDGVTDDPSVDGEEETANRNGAPARKVTRRRTSRPKKVKPEDPEALADDAPEQDESTPEISTENSSAAESDATGEENSEENGDKKQSWWKTGGGFFG